MSRPLRRRAALARTPRRAFVVGAVMSSVLALGASVVPFGVATAATPSPSASASAGDVSLTLSPSANGILTPGQPLTATVMLDNDSSAGFAAGRVTLEIGTRSFTDRAGLRSWLADGSPGATLTSLGAADLAAAAAGADTTARVTVAADDPTLSALPPGVYPLLAAAESPTGTVRAMSAVIVSNGAARATAGLVVPVTAPATAAGLLTADQLSDLTSTSGALTATLQAVSGAPAILAVDPAIVASIRALGSSAPPSATAWLSRLDALSNPRFALQFGDADIAAQLDAGQARPLSPLSLSAYLRPVDFTGANAAGATPAPTSTAGPDVPSTDDLLHVGGIPDVYWPATGTAGPSVVASLGSLGSLDQPSLTLVPSSSTDSGAQGRTVPARATAGEASLLVYDSDVSAALGTASGEDDSARRAAALTAANAYMFFASSSASASASGDGRPLLFAVDRNPARTASGLTATIAAIDAAPQVDLVPWAQLRAATADPLTIVDAAPEQTRVDAASGLVRDESRVQSFAGLLSDPTVLTGPQRAEVLQLLGNGWRGNASGWSDALTAHHRATETTLDSVQLLDPSPSNIAGSGAPLGVWVRNDLPYPVELTLAAEPADPRLVVQRSVSFTAPAQSNTRVKVPVESRVGNGDVTVRLQLLAHTGEVVGPSRTMDVSVRAEWEGFGVIGLSILITLLIGMGIIRTILRRRRARPRPVE